MKTLEYNYRSLQLKDLRYRGNSEKGYYILSFAYKGKSISPININKSIFETVLYKYYTPLFNKTFSRKELFDLTFCAHLTEGHYLQWNAEYNEYMKVDGVQGRIYVSRLDIEGDLDQLTYNEKNEMHNLHTN